MYRHSAPLQEIKIVSTNEEKYAYAVYAQRVQNKEIYIERLSGDSVLLHITKLELKDEGVFECYTPNTDAEYLGIYSAQTNVTGASSVTLRDQEIMLLKQRVERRFHNLVRIVSSGELAVGRGCGVEGLVDAASFGGGNGFQGHQVTLQQWGGERLVAQLSWPPMVWTCSGKDNAFFRLYLPLTSSGSFWHLIIPDTLSVMSAAQTVNKVEGDSLQLTCEVSKQTSQHSHVSVAWFLRTSEQSALQDVVTLSKDFVLRSGSPYKQRFSSGDVRLDKTSSTAYRLSIYKLQPADQGEIYCEAAEWIQDPDRSWFAMTRKKSEKTVVNVQPTVIPDTLSVMSAAQTVNKVEGDSLQLTCEVSKQTSQHSHVSVAWFLRTSEQSALQDVVTLSKDFVLRSGSPYKQRFSSGDVRLDKTSSTAYRLSIYKLQPADQGEIYCEAAEWIQDPDRSWFAMTRKKSEKTVVNVQPTDKDFSIQLNTERRAYTAGEPLELRCNIDAQSVPDRFFSVSWVFSSSPVAVVGPNAVPVLSGDYVQREAAGQLTVRKDSDSVYLLKIQRLQPEDSGKYICRVTEREKTATGDFIDKSKRSRNVQISVQPLKQYSITELAQNDKEREEKEKHSKSRSNITVSVSSNSTNVIEGDAIHFTCSVRSTLDKEGSLSFSWQLVDKQGSTQDIAAVDQIGTVRLGPSYRERSSYGEIRVERVRPDTFTLSVYNTLPKDEGQYKCGVAEWVTRPDGSWEKIGEKSAGKLVTVTAVESMFSIVASSRTPSVTYNDSFDLQCIVKPRYNRLVPVSVTWRFQPANGTEFRDLVTFTRDGTLQWGGQLSGFGTRTTIDKSASSSNFRLGVSRASRRESGTYQCSAELWRKNYDGTWARVTNRTSNPLGITVMKPGKKTCLDTPATYCIQQTDNERSQIRDDTTFLSAWWIRLSPPSLHELPSLKSRPDRLLVAGFSLLSCSLGTVIPQARKRTGRVGPSLYFNVCGAPCLQRSKASQPGVFSDFAELIDVSVSCSAVSKLRVSKLDQNLELLEDSRVRLNCSITARTSPESQYTVLWYARKAGEPDAELLLKINHNSAFEYGTYAEEERLKSRVQSERLSPQLYSLTLHQAELSDSGTYYCRVHEWQLDPNNVWYQLAEETSGFTEVLVKQPEKGQDEMELVSAPLTTTIHNIYRHKTLELCSEGAVSAKIIKRNLKVIPTSIALKKQYFSKPFWRVFHRFRGSFIYFFADVEIDLFIFGKSEMAFAAVCYAIMLHVLIQKLIISRSLTQNISFNICIFIGFPFFVYCSYIRLQVEESESNLTVVETEAFRLGCSIPSQSSKDSRFSVSWYVLRAKAGAGEGPECIFSIGHDAVFGNGNCSPSEGSGPGSRLQFERPSAELYSLTVQRAGLADSGSYYCHVEEWLLNPRNAWYRLATNNSGATLVDVRERGTSLQSVICSNDSLFYFVFFYPFPIFGILLITILLVRYKARNSSKNSEGKNGAPLLWIKEPHINYSPTCLDPPTLSLHPGSVE
ncbi:IGSF3 protein, partial [Atractosteus spatula]|nr:IGSF3 protein [Atractosteus spatula]